jgi:protein-arginine deiminase
MTWLATALPTACVALALAAGCSEVTEVPFGGGGGAGVGGSGVGGVGAGGDAGQGAALFITPNLDDDDQDGQADWAASAGEADDELVPWSLPAAWVARVGQGETLRLGLVGDTADVRLWRGGQVVLGPAGSAEPVTELALGPSELATGFEVETRTFHRHASLRVDHLGSQGEPLDHWSVELWGAPLVLGHHVDPVERLYVVETGDNQPLVSLLQELAGERLTVVQSTDRWIQDELEWATASEPEHRIDIAMDSIRDRELDAWVKGLAAPNVEPITWGQSAEATTEDKFGNLETTPPFQAAGTDYPLGRIYLGDNGVVGPNETLQNALDEQQVQAPLRVDTSWLCIGHVDEFMAFVPAPEAPKGFVLLYADVPAGYALLDAMAPDTLLPRYADSHGYASPAELVGDASLRALNEDVQADYLDPIRAELMAELELAESDVVRVPALFERLAGCPYSSSPMEVVALVPAMVNLTVANFEGQAPQLVVPDPFLRADLGSQEGDPLIAAFRAAMPAGVETHFVDSWYSYHVSWGDIHCGTNAMRTPTVPWYEAALHLLGGS